MLLARVTSHASVLLVLGGLPLTTACGAAHGAPGPSQVSSNGSAGSPFHSAVSDRRTGTPDSLDRALDRVDAAHAALDAADAATVKAMRDLDLALDDVSRLTGGPPPARYRADAAAFGVDGDRIAERVQEDVDRASTDIEHNVLPRAARAVRIAERQAELAVRRSRLGCECSRDRDSWNDDRGDRGSWGNTRHKSWNDSWDDGDEDEDHDGTDRY